MKTITFVPLPPPPHHLVTESVLADRLKSTMFILCSTLASSDEGENFKFLQLCCVKEILIDLFGWSTSKKKWKNATTQFSAFHGSTKYFFVQCWIIYIFVPQVIEHLQWMQLWLVLIILIGYKWFKPILESISHSQHWIKSFLDQSFEAFVQ